MADISIDQIIRRLGEKDIEILQIRQALEEAGRKIQELEVEVKAREAKIFPKPVRATEEK